MTNVVSAKSGVNCKDSCIVCGGLDHQLKYKSTFNGSAREASQYFLSHRKSVVHGRIVRCGACGFVFTSPRFSDKEYQEIYRNAPAAPQDGNSLDLATAARFQNLANIVREYVNGGSFLDFGCGAGGFLDVMKNQDGVGFEVGQQGRRTSIGGLPIITGSFQDAVGHAPLLDEAFSFVTAFDVFEHLSNLPHYVFAMRRLIAENGYLFITVPNIDSFVAKLTGEHWNMILLEHLWYFSPRTLRRFIEPCGFSHVATYGLPYAAPVSHLFKRFSQTYGIELPALPRRIGSIVARLPIGLMIAIYRRE